PEGTCFALRECCDLRPADSRPDSPPGPHRSRPCEREPPRGLVPPRLPLPGSSGAPTRGGHVGRGVRSRGAVPHTHRSRPWFPRGSRSFPATPPFPRRTRVPELRDLLLR